ncbi:hypothetical protein D3C80_2162040 [compost metagenome]
MAEKRLSETAEVLCRPVLLQLAAPELLQPERVPCSANRNPDGGNQGAEGYPAGQHAPVRQGDRQRPGAR